MGHLGEELHSTLYPVWDNTYRVRAALELYEGVSTHVDELQRYSHFFGLIQMITLDYAALGICRMFDRSSPRNRKDTVQTTLKFLKANLTPKFARRLKTETLTKMGISDEISQKLTAGLTSSFEDSKDVLLNEVERSMPTISNNESLEKLFLYRDKILAHQDHLTTDSKEKLKFLPSLGHMEDINVWAEQFCTLCMSLLSNVTLLPPSFSARIAALNLAAKLLDKKFEIGSKEYKEFYKRLPD